MEINVLFFSILTPPPNLHGCYEVLVPDGLVWGEIAMLCLFCLNNRDFFCRAPLERGQRSSQLHSFSRRTLHNQVCYGYMRDNPAGAVVIN